MRERSEGNCPAKWLALEMNDFGILSPNLRPRGRGLTDEELTKISEQLVASRLEWAGVLEPRCSLLSSPRRCMEMLRDGDTAWDVLVALCIHIRWDQAHRLNSRIDWQSEVSEPVFLSVSETERFRPEFIGIQPSFDAENPQLRVPFDPDLSRYAHSRVAAALLIQDDRPDLALQFLASVNEMLPPKTQARLSQDLSYDLVNRVRLPLQQLYEQLGHYELALQLHRMRGAWTSPAEHFALAEFYLERWTSELKDSATVQEAKVLLDAVYSILVDSDRVNEKVRDSLADCPKDTRQYWAWFYGRTVGLLKIAHPYLKDALLNELNTYDWVEGWAAATVLIEEHTDWVAHRKACMTLFWASDIEYKGARPWNARQPAHLSASSDLYWAIRVGFCDAKIEAENGTALPSNVYIREQLDDIKQITSSGGLRAIRSHKEVMQEFALLRQGIPTEEAARKSIGDEIGQEMLESLPVAIIEHLVAAWLARIQGRPSEARVATVKAIEAVFTRIVKNRLRETAPRTKVRVARPNGKHWTYSLERIGHVQLADWSILLPDLVRGKGENKKLRDALSRGFPSIDWELLDHCATGLSDASNARGQAAHDADRESYDHAIREADRLWSIAVGSLTTPGLISMLSTALGVGRPEET